MGWNWAAACGVHGRGHVVRPRAQLVIIIVIIIIIIVISQYKLRRSAGRPICYSGAVALAAHN